jgi:putative PIN family toxin of toxin-antitoxin system
MSERGAPRAIVDTNLFVSGLISPLGPPGRLLDVWHAGWFNLYLSDLQLAELTEVVSRPKIVRDDRITPQALANLLAGLSLATRVVASPSIPIPLRDPKDEHILAAALGGNADYLVTSDFDLLVHQGDPHLGTLKIVTAAQFLAILEDSDNTN